MIAFRSLGLALALIAGGTAAAQDKGSLNPAPLPALAHPTDPSTPAKQLFGRARAPASMTPHAIGFYSRGCLAGGEALPIDGDSWQVMRLSRNRNYGHPNLIAFLEEFGKKVPAITGWAGLLVGDMAQPRGGPMLTGHASHQIGLDADIWLTPMPQRRFTRIEREEVSATDVVAADKLDVNSAWTPQHMALIRAAAQDRAVQRIFVNAAIKKAMCRDARGDRSWLSKVRPMWGHNYHFHVRLFCPDGGNSCHDQDPVPAGDGCDASLDWWFSDAVLHPRPPKVKPKPKPPMTLAQLPPACRQVLASP